MYMYFTTTSTVCGEPYYNVYLVSFFYTLYGQQFIRSNMALQVLVGFGVRLMGLYVLSQMVN